MLQCTLVQNVTQLPHNVLFESNYPYYSSVSKAVRDHAEDIARGIAKRLVGKGRALEVGSNDGTVQLALMRLGIDSFGVDPASGPVAMARKKGCRALCAPFDETAAETVLGEFGTVDVVHMSNVLAHVSDPLSILKSAQLVLDRSGYVMIEVQSWRDLVNRGAFDMIYHEHHCHFSLRSLSSLCNAAGLGVVEVEHFETQGGSLRLWCQPGVENTSKVTREIAAEDADLENSGGTLCAKVEDFRGSVAAFAKQSSAKTVYGYAASAKSVTLLSILGLNLRIQAIGDAAVAKQGKFLPVQGIPIISPEMLSAAAPDVIILFAWNLADELLSQMPPSEIWVPIPSFRRVL